MSILKDEASLREDLAALEGVLNGIDIVTEWDKWQLFADQVDSLTMILHHVDNLDYQHLI